MRITLPQLAENTLDFPPLSSALASPDGLLAFGGDLSPSRLMRAYQSGIFPWFSPGEPILWWSPSRRMILPANDFHVSRSLRKHLRRMNWRVTLNQAFHQVIETCATINRQDQGTWITDEMIAAYKALHQMGAAHSIEVWEQQQLIGGLYGVAPGAVFCGESMFHHRSNASKVAFYALTTLLQPLPDAFIDCQMHTDHLASLGAFEISRTDFAQRLHDALVVPTPDNFWHPRTLLHP